MRTDLKTILKAATGISMALLITGCGGGGGGPSIPNQPAPIHPVPPVDPVVPPPPPPPPPPPLTPLQIEYNNSPGLVGIGAQTAYDAGYTGLGVKVAVIDTGATASHPELIANLSREHIMEKGTILTHTGDIWTSYYGVKGWVPEEINFTGDQVIKVSYSMTDSDQVYTSAPAITITGDGTGATAEALLDANGKIKAVVITNPGSGYTHVSASVDDATGNIAISDIRLAGVDEAGAYSNGHGTFVLSQIGARAGDGGIRGVANNATLFSIKARNEYGINMDQVLDGVDG